MANQALQWASAPSSMSYGISSRAYLARAISLLERGTDEALFHSAFELRCGIEARMEEYLDAWDEITKKKKRGWQVRELARDVEKSFKVGNKVVRLGVHEEKGGACLISFYYTPVSSGLQRSAEKLGNYLHSKKKSHSSDDPWWVSFRSELNDVAERLAIANTGTLLGPLLWRPETREASLKVELLDGASPESLLGSLPMGAEKVFRVDYLAQLPNPLESVAHCWKHGANQALKPTAPPIGESAA